jgi:hypothetical protein
LSAPDLAPDLSRKGTTPYKRFAVAHGHRSNRSNVRGVHVSAFHGSIGSIQPYEWIIYGRDLDTDYREVKTRTVISAMWFVALWMLCGALHVYLNIDRAWMLLPTVAFAAGVWIGLARYEAWRASRSNPEIETAGARAIGSATSSFDVGRPSTN